MGEISLFICGGHFSPALAVIEELRRHKNLNIYYIGRKFALEGDKTFSLEFNSLSKLKIPFLALTTGRLQRHFSWQWIHSLLKIPLGFIQSLFYLLRFKPVLVLSFGGYVALPVSLSAFVLGIPVITHEQTRIMGLTNRFIALIAKFTCLSFANTRRVPLKSRIVITGLPVRKSIINPHDTGLTLFGNTRLPLIYVTGGSLGSRSINSLLFEIIPNLLKKYRIFHVCGESAQGADYHRLAKLKSPNYYLIPYLDYDQVGEVIKNSALVIGRSGINTVAEILIHRKKAVLIPLPWAAYNEQWDNAQILIKAGLAEVLNQQQLKSKILLLTIIKMLEKDIKTVNTDVFQDWQFTGVKKITDLILTNITNIGGFSVEE